MEDYRKRSSGSKAVIDSAENLRLIGLDTRSGPFRAALASEYVGTEIFLRERNSRLYAIDDDAYRLAMGFSEDGDSEFTSE